VKSYRHTNSPLFFGWLRVDIEEISQPLHNPQAKMMGPSGFAPGNGFLMTSQGYRP
jgi:hypothetical protein